MANRTLLTLQSNYQAVSIRDLPTNALLDNDFVDSSVKNEDDDEGDGKKKGSSEFGGLAKIELPLEYKIIYLIRKNKPDKAFKLLIKAMEKARTPKQMAMVFGVAHVAKEELKAMQWWEDIEKIDKYILIGSAPAGTDIHRNQYVVIDYSLFTSASLPLPGGGYGARKNVGGFSTAPEQYSYSFTDNTSRFNNYSYSLSGSIDHISYGEIDYSGFDFAPSVNQEFKSLFESISNDNSFALSEPFLLDLDMVSEIAQREGTNGVITNAFQDVSSSYSGYGTYDARYSYGEVLSDQGQDQFEDRTFDYGSFSGDIHSLLQGGTDDVYKAVRMLKDAVNQVDLDSLSSNDAKFFADMFSDIHKIFDHESSLDANVLKDLDDAFDALSADIKKELEDLLNISSIDVDSGNGLPPPGKLAKIAAQQTLTENAKMLESFVERMKNAKPDLPRNSLKLDKDPVPQLSALSFN